MYGRVSIGIPWSVYYSLYGRFVKKLIGVVTMEKLSGAAARTGDLREKDRKKYKEKRK